MILMLFCDGIPFSTAIDNRSGITIVDYKQ